MSAVAEATLVDRLRARDPMALEALLARFAARLYRLAHGITGSTADAEEVVQDVFLTAYRTIDGFEGRASLGTWLHRITVNAALNRRRGKRREVEVPIEECLPRFLDDGHREGDRTYLLADWSAAPDEELLSRETRRMVRTAIDRLPDDHRAVVLLRDVEGLTNEEAAEALGESVAAVKSRLHRARMALREQITRARA